MRTALVVVALALLPSASASIEIYFSNSSKFGLTNPSNGFAPSSNKSLDFTSGDYVLLAAAPCGTPTINPSVGGWAYVWLQFKGEPEDCQVKGLHLGVEPWDLVENLAWYVVDDRAGVEHARWDGTPPFTEHKRNPCRMTGVAVGSAGLKNTATTSYDWNLYDKTARTYLLGAVKFKPPTGVGYTARPYLGSLGIGTTGCAPEVNVHTAWISEEPRRGDLNCDGEVNFDDIDPFVLALGGEAGYLAKYPCCNWMGADINCDGKVDFDDIEPFVACLGGVCTCPP